jgi:hypothetical protein
MGTSVSPCKLVFGEAMWTRLSITAQGGVGFED